MIRRCLLVAVMGWALAAGAQGAQGAERKVVASAPQLAREAQRDFEQTLDLWRDGRYEEVYRRSRGEKDTREGLTRKLAEGDCRPACCWEKLQNPEVTVKGESLAIIHGTVGLERGGAATEFRTRQFRLTREDGVWKVQRSDLLSLSGAKKEKKKKARS